jgi:2-C-methyl-D-erythritol 4-phosphate cytidylyltransferase
MVIALVLSGGTGFRLGAKIPKQYIEVLGKPIISYCLETISAHDMIDAIHIVADDKWQREISGWLGEEDIGGKFMGFSLPGENRQLSIYNGLCDINEYATSDDYVIIHDAARPFLTGDMITKCLDAVEGHDGVVPVLPMKDTVYLSDDGIRVSSLLKREDVYAGQAPEVFVLGKYLEANWRLLPYDILKIHGSTEPAILAGMDIAMIPGDEGNFKITTQDDLERMRAIVYESMGITRYKRF